MQKLIFTTLLLLFSAFSFSQEPRNITKNDSLQIDRKINIEVVKLKKELEIKYAIEDQKDLMIEFEIDTFRIERFSSEQMEIDYSTAGMVFATMGSTEKYDKLLNKYYKKLMSMLSEKDKDVLRKAQRNWILFRDSEIELIGMLADEKYSGGGSIQTIYNASLVNSITKARMLEIHQHLLRISH